MPDNNETIVQLNGDKYEVEVVQRDGHRAVHFANIKDELTEQEWHAMNERIESALQAMHSIK